ncbi:hypothetical protein [Paenibacillus illinoisensis]
MKHPLFIFRYILQSEYHFKIKPMKKGENEGETDKMLGGKAGKLGGFKE